MSGTGAAGFMGEAPHVGVRERTHECAKYESMWAREEYRAVAPGEALATTFLSVAHPPAGAEVIDFGAGTGRGALLLAVVGQCRVHMVDFAANALDDDIRQMLKTQAHVLDFTLHDLNKPLSQHAEYGFCTDVMEHIPPAEVDQVLHNVLSAAQYVFFQIDTGDDVCGKLIGEPLHLSVHDYAWWRAKFEEFKARIIWSENRGGACRFYVTAWSTGEDLKKAGVLNVEEDTIRSNVRANCRAGWMQITPHKGNESELMILAGGPTLDDQLSTIQKMRADGVGLVTLNGAYNWAIMNGIAPGCQIMCDARPHNKRFVQPVIDGCKYLMGSQCDPEAIAHLPPDRTYLWHTSAESIQDILNEEVPGGWFGVPGGCTVLLRAIPLLRMLGFSKFHLFGADSCLMERTIDGAKVMRHHPYEQPENDGHLVIPVTLGNRMFYCHPWMAAQASEFMDLIRYFGETFQVEVYGDGLLAWIMQHAADEDLKSELKAAAEAAQTDQ